MALPHLRSTVCMGLLIAVALSAGCGSRGQRKSTQSLRTAGGTPKAAPQGAPGKATEPAGLRESARSTGGEPAAPASASDQAREPAPAEEKVADVPPAFSLDAAAYIRQLENDPGTFKKYEGKVVELKGVVKGFEVSTGGGYAREGEPAIDLEVSGKEISAIRVRTRERQPWSWICPGQVIKIKGKVLIDTVVEDGVITEAERSPAVVTTAEELAREGQADREKASKRYKDQWVILAGEVVSRRVGESDARLTLKGAGKYPIRAAVTEAAMWKRVAAQKAGDKVTLLGRVGGFSDDAVRLQDCLLITAGK